MTQSGFDWLGKWAVYTPDRLFLREHSDSNEWTYAEFNHCAEQCAEYLSTELRINKGDMVAVYSINSAEHVLLYAACVKTGAVLVPLNFRLTPGEMQMQINDCRPKVLFYSDEYEKQTRELANGQTGTTVLPLENVAKLLSARNTPEGSYPKPALSEDDTVMILYTAGTTGVPKGVKITHKMLFWNAVNTGLRLDISSTDHTHGFAPFFHTGGWNVLFTPFLFHGASHTLLRKFEADVILDLMEKEKTTILFGVPTMLQMISEVPGFAGANLESLRYAIVGGAPMPVPLIKTWHKKGVYIRQGYGLTEVGPNCFSLHQNDAERKIGSIGQPNFYIETRIVKDNGEDAAAGEEGELWLKSPVVTPGYLNKDKETAECITDGWFHTGDMVKMDSEGYFFVVDRKKNMYISGGENVYPAETERLLYTFPGMKEVSVIGVPDERWGETGKIYAVIEQGNAATPQQLIDFCRGKLAGYKIPKHAEIISELPKTDAGKINKRALLQRHLESINQHSLKS